jgi:antitoxin (DNA-binding transcriptional repressor) of toxin-antitoxin stability system
MTISEARAALPEVLNRVDEGEEITITRHGRAAAVVVRPDIFWPQANPELILGDMHQVVAALRERAKRSGRTLEEELRMIQEAAEAEPQHADLPPIESQITTVHAGGKQSWSREDIYDDDGR